MKKEHIFEQSEKLFYAKKYTDVKLDKIATQLWIKKQSLYHYFENKKQLFIETLKYSINKYINELKETTKEKNIDNFIEWFLIYPQKNKNLFAISFQKWVCTDKYIRSIIIGWKQKIFDIIIDYFLKYWFDDVKTYLILNLLEKLSQENCVEWYCLHYDIDVLKNYIRDLFISS